MKIPIFKLEFEKEFISKYLRGCEEILTSNRPLGEDKYVSEFEQKFAKLVGAKYALATTNGTSALELALRCVDVKGKTVIIPTNTFSATSIAVSNAGGSFSLLDIEENYFSFLPAVLEKEILRLKKKKEKIGAVIVVHIGGIITTNIAGIVSVCRKHKVPLIEDAAHAHLSQYKNFKAGTIGVFGCFSFFPTKVMTTGEGGMITTNSKKMFSHAKSLKNFGRDSNNIDLIINEKGDNFKMNEVTALLGSLECDRVFKRVEKRNMLTDMYVNLLRGSSYIPVLQDAGLSSQYKMILKTKIKQEKLKPFCKANGISLTGEVYKIPIHQQPIYKKLFKHQKFPNSDRISQYHICPPLYPELTVAEVKYICKTLIRAEKAFLKK
ncbi:MAG TPA: DegT/DnrJ/EryC1/StrS family aminotransferase [Candidatus Levybacteria bacterium]|nr:DegT/DnrJ/EryC1/StrS family aminotransferase [Candidatus Levybacteria bacterium]